MVQALDRGLRILEILSEQTEMSITELADMLDVDKSTVSRLVETLRQHDMVQLNKSTKKYRMGFRILHFGKTLEKNLNIIDIARPILKDVSGKLSENVHLCAFNNTMAYVIDQVVRDSGYSISATIGMIEPMHASSVGKCILAYRPEHSLRQMLNHYDYVKYTEKTIQDQDSLMRELAKIKRQGYALDDEEVSVGIRCVAVPIFSFGNQVRYSIGISLLASLMPDHKVKGYADKLSRAAAKISRELGC